MMSLGRALLRFFIGTYYGAFWKHNIYMRMLLIKAYWYTNHI
ncbi:hypothetical protein GV51_0169 [Gardnerella vaginalis 5-1]|nr:hypothetical protein GV51_0169 [Gardnerella vaginalis 5-1]